MTAKISSVQHQSVLSHEANTLLVKVDIGQSRHWEICIMVQIDHNAYDYSQHMTLAHDASQYFSPFGDVGIVRLTGDHTRYTNLQALRMKDEAFQGYALFLLDSSSTRRTYQRLRSDPSGEFTTNQFAAEYQQQATERRLATADTPYQIVWPNHSTAALLLIMERTHAIQRHPSLPKRLWAEDIYFAV